LTFVLTPHIHTLRTRRTRTHGHASLDAHCCLNRRWGEITQFISVGQQSGAGLSGKTTMRRWRWRWRLLYINKPKERKSAKSGRIWAEAGAGPAEQDKTVDNAAKQAKKHCINLGARIPNE